MYVVKHNVSNVKYKIEDIEILYNACYKISISNTRYNIKYVT